MFKTCASGLCASVLFLCAAFAAAQDECIVSRRLPPFALRTGRRNVDFMKTDKIAETPSSRLPGGACHMGRLMRVNNSFLDSEQTHSTQMCTRNSTALRCAVLVQNDSSVLASRQRLRVFEAHTPADGVQDARKTHSRSRPCAACHRQKIDTMLTRFMQQRKTSARTQLSLGLPLRLSAARLLAAQLHRDICNSSNTCPPLEAALSGACDGDCMLQDRFMSAFLNRKHFEPENFESAAKEKKQLTGDAKEALWNRNWVWCKHTTGPSAEFAQCQGRVEMRTWLNVSTRARACAEHIPVSASSTVSVNFCLLNAKTTRLCDKMFQWRSEAREIICRASGKCPTTDFFYSPTTFDLREQQFVYDSVVDFYKSQGKSSCAASFEADEQQKVNEATMGRCASVHIEPLLVIVEQMREAKRILLLIAYHCYRVQFYLLQLLVSATTDTAAALASASTDTVGRVADSLLREVMALMQVIGSFIDQLRDSIMELAMSRGVGKIMKDLLVFVCQVIELMHNVLWSYLLCPLLSILMIVWEFMIDVVDMLMNIVRIVLFGNPEILEMLDNFISTCRDMVAGITRTLGTCAPKNFNCVVEPTFGGNDTDFGTLPMPTRCWTSYLTFFGDNQQMSCSKADTCKLSRLASLSQRQVCGACPQQPNSNVLDFACDYLTGMCTCAVPQLSSTSCFANEDCMADADATCRLINDDLEISKASVICAQCQYQQMCYMTSEGGVCACGARQRALHTCSEDDHRHGSALSLRLNDLCLYTATDSVVEFTLSSVIPCMELDSSLSSCVFAVDLNTYLARGFRRVRRRLLGDETRIFTYRSMDSVCRDALLSNTLYYTRISCQEAFENSNQTLALLGLDRQLPPCTLCSFADALQAVRHNPVAVLHILNPHVLRVVLQRHGPFVQATQLATAFHSSMQEFSSALARRNASQVVFIERAGDLLRVRVQDTTVPPHIARALEHLLESVLPHLSAFSGMAGESTNISNNSFSHTAYVPGRRLLLFRELVLAVEQRVRSGWQDAGRIHEAFSQGIEQVLTYDYDTSRQHVWPPLRSPGTDTCNELHELLLISVDVAQGVLDGWMTLTHERNRLQSTPAESLTEAWPALARAEPDLDPPNEALQLRAHKDDDAITQTCISAVAFGLRVLQIEPRIVYDVFYSIASAANISFTCPYSAVQTCSAWRRRLWHAVVIVVLWFSAAYFVVNALGLSFVASLLVPMFSLVVLQLCYGYTWKCVPMIPVCALQDFSETVAFFLPLSLELPDDLKLQHRHCLDDSACDGSNDNVCLLPLRYPPPRCLKSCRDTPFDFTSWRDVLAWTLADVGPWASISITQSTQHVPLFDHQAFGKKIDKYKNTLQRTTADSVRAHRLCAVLSSYMLLPYVFIIMLLLVFVANLAQVLATQLLLLFLLMSTLFNAVATRANSEDEDRMLTLEQTVEKLQMQDEEE